MPSRPIIRPGDRGKDVMYLQQLLNKKGYSLKVDGDFGPRTQAAVKQFQKSHHLTVDAIVGPATWNALLS